MIAAFLWLGLLGLFNQGTAPIETGKGPPEELSQEACQMCHQNVAHEWQASRHGQAWTNPIFQREYRQKPQGWCVHCHAPLAAQWREVRDRWPGGGALAAEGVNCAVCHVRDGHILAASRRPNSPHDTSVRADFGKPAFCAGCHQFNFPLLDDDGEVRVYTRYPMQNTVAQFRAGPYAGGTCRKCHARSAAGHAYPGAHDRGMLLRAVALSLCRTGDAAEISVKNAGAGHNVPTGDVHRHLLLRLWRPGAPERLHETRFGRRYRPVPGGGKETVEDTTLRPDEVRRIRVPFAELGDESDGPLRLELRYVYTIDEFPLPTQRLGEPTYQVIDERTVSAGEVPGCGR